MNLKRASTPPPSEDVSQRLMAPPLTPGAPLPKTIIPPSPGGHRLDILAAAATSKRPAKIRAPPVGSKRSLIVGVRKPATKTSKAKIETSEAKDDIAFAKMSTGLMDLPGEIRNLIYSFTQSNSRQALLVYRPRLASLRSRTRLDRHRTLPSDILEQKHDEAFSANGHRGSTRGSSRKCKSGTLARETNRPFYGLTQVCRLLRAEFRPLYLQKQEIGIDLVEVVQYLQTFYPEAPEQFKALSISTDRKIDMPFTGNLTIAVGDKLKAIEKAVEGIDVWPLLDLWANSFKIEAGFGRYMAPHYDATADGEAKDLYRLFGRQVQADRRCSVMNVAWRTVLRTRSLASVTIHRKPASTSSTSGSPPQQAARLAVPVVIGPRPYIHILFRADTAEPWMTKAVSKIPQAWLKVCGLDSMEYFDIKVGVEPTQAD
ncbi:hypothetical protein E8E12_004205 [Didymella heteroderae]|uniref:F-box domain-containing protein n=1 Tax=Didymella heteroderae TaxID=1769908 RepID=A0A9P4WI80_9PLEO|nr:hypothetical protein E8E12_004205 [Didymella heteroderae]